MDKNHIFLQLDSRLYQYYTKLFFIIGALTRIHFIFRLWYIGVNLIFARVNLVRNLFFEKYFFGDFSVAIKERYYQKNLVEFPQNLPIFLK